MSSKLQGRTPILMSIGLVLVIIYGAFQRFQSAAAIEMYSGWLMIALYLLWLLVESRIALAETKKDSTNRDFGTLEAYALARLVTVITALYLPANDSSDTPQLIGGLVLFLGGIGFRLVAIRTLGKFYSHRVRLADDHQIVQEGPYSMLRHPAYTGMLIGHLGFVIFFYNQVALAVWALFFVPAVIARILVEEKALMLLPGYADFARTRKRLLPFVW
jgi:protein-S-isoprenylcysteine O-methyltransferase Ste14